MSTQPNTLSREEIISLNDADFEKLVRECAGPDRHESMWQACKLLPQADGESIVETGSIRGFHGDGQSTLIWTMLAIRLSKYFYSFDLNTKPAKEWLGPIDHVPDFIEGDSIESFGLWEPIATVGLLYLDSYDYQADNPLPCQIHQLAELGAVYWQLSEKSIILLDDAAHDGGGKVKLSSEFLKLRGWTLRHNAYQQLFTNF